LLLFSSALLVPLDGVLLGRPHAKQHQLEPSALGDFSEFFQKANDPEALQNTDWHRDLIIWLMALSLID
jgi:hypothetical protein